jgi:DinB superfamily
MLLDDFNHIIDYWIAQLDQYSFEQLCSKPAPGKWSLGQLYLHLLADTNYYIGQMEGCVLSNDHAGEEASPDGREMLLNNDFPDEVLEGSPNNSLIPQPGSRDQLRNEMIKLRDDMNDMADRLGKTPFRGKTKHPGLNYFSAVEWLQLAEMHFRHHLRQKKRIDEFLGKRTEGW